MHAWPELHLPCLLIVAVCKQAKVTLYSAHMMQGKSTAGGQMCQQLTRKCMKNTYDKGMVADTYLLQLTQHCGMSK